jgi:hypothetical protein
MPLDGIKERKRIIISFENSSLWVRALHARAMTMRYTHVMFSRVLNLPRSMTLCQRGKNPQALKWVCSESERFFQRCVEWVPLWTGANLKGAGFWNVTSSSLVQTEQSWRRIGCRKFQGWSKQRDHTGHMNQQKTCLAACLRSLHPDSEDGSREIHRNLG